jgi:predicted CXXCH cytochrome family protein
MTKRDKNVIFLCSFWSLLFPFLLVSASAAQSDTCVAVSCHPQMGKGKFIHPPLKDGCTVCHLVTREPAGGTKSRHPGNMTISLAQKGAGLCYLCHEPLNRKKVVHAPVAGGDCTTCHDPHQSGHKAMLRDSMPQLCFSCHSGSMAKHKVMHAPVAEGDCSGCHENHQSDFPGRLVREGNALCYSCHPDKEDGLRTRKVIHRPVQQSCVQCHSPHGSANRALLSAAVPALCSNCHPNQIALLEKALVKHGPMLDPKSCMNCHDPHYSDNARLLPRPQLDLCLTCHDRRLDTERGSIPDMKAWLSANKNAHGPMIEKDCVACHNPHGSEYWRILVRYYPADFYASYTEGRYALCFSCHDKSAFADLRTENATNFRNGDKNLHFAHVNKAAKGRTCRACHEVHADSGIPHHVKERVEFNGWSMPMNYSPGKSGGSCAPGCHGEKSYSR